MFLIAYNCAENVYAGMAKLVDALDLGSSGATHKSSTLFTRTNYFDTHFNTQDNCVDSPVRVPMQILHRTRPKPGHTIQPYKLR